MTEEMLALARRNAAQTGASNVTFLKGHIEQIPLPAAGIEGLRDARVCRIVSTGYARDALHSLLVQSPNHLRTSLPMSNNVEKGSRR